MIAGRHSNWQEFRITHGSDDRGMVNPVTKP